MTERKTCYGNMFPDFAQERLNERNRGKAFSVIVESVGIGIQKRAVTTDLEEWEDCLQCPDYRTCYDLSMAKLHLWKALQSFA